MMIIIIVIVIVFMLTSRRVAPSRVEQHSAGQDFDDDLRAGEKESESCFALVLRCFLALH